MSGTSRISWQKALHIDGSLRDIYVQGTTEKEWVALFSFLEQSGYSLSYTKDGREFPVPPHPTLLGDTSCAHLLAIDIGEGVLVHCHYYVPEEIELDVDPREVNSPESVACLERFFVGLGNALAQDVVLTEENSAEHVLMRYSPSDGLLRNE